MTKHIPWKLLFNNVLKIKSFKMPFCVLLLLVTQKKTWKKKIKIWNGKLNLATQLGMQFQAILSHGSWTCKEVRALSKGSVQVTRVQPSSLPGQQCPGLRCERSEALVKRSAVSVLSGVLLAARVAARGRGRWRCRWRCGAGAGRGRPRLGLGLGGRGGLGRARALELRQAVPGQHLLQQVAVIAPVINPHLPQRLHQPPLRSGFLGRAGLLRWDSTPQKDQQLN